MPANLRNLELERAIIASPDDRTLRELYADWLIERGDPRGAFMSVQLRDDPTLRSQEQTLLAESRQALLGPFGDWVDSVEGGASASFTWRAGFLDSVSLEFEHSDHVIAVLERLFGSASAALLRTLELHVGHANAPALSASALPAVYQRLAALAPASLRALQVHADALGPLDGLAAMASLRSLEVSGDALGGVGTLTLERLGVAVAADPLEGLVDLQVPALRELDLDYARSLNGGSNVVLARQVFKRLKSLEVLRLRRLPALDDLSEVVAQARALKVLDLSGSWVSRPCVMELERAFLHRPLQRLVLNDAEVAPDCVRRLAALTKRLEVDDHGGVVAAGREGVVLVLDRPVDRELICRAALQVARVAEVSELFVWSLEWSYGHRPVTLLEVSTNDARFSMDTFAASLARRGSAQPRPERFRVLQLGWSDRGDRSAWRLLSGEDVVREEGDRADAATVASGLELFFGARAPAPAPGLTIAHGVRHVVRFGRKDLPDASVVASYAVPTTSLATMALLAPRPRTVERAPAARTGSLVECTECHSAVPAGEAQPCSCGAPLCARCLEEGCAACRAEAAADDFD